MLTSDHNDANRPLLEETVPPHKEGVMVSTTNDGSLGGLHALEAARRRSGSLRVVVGPLLGLATLGFFRNRDITAHAGAVMHCERLCWPNDVVQRKPISSKDDSDLLCEKSC